MGYLCFLVYRDIRTVFRLQVFTSKPKIYCLSSVTFFPLFPQLYFSSTTPSVLGQLNLHLIIFYLGILTDFLTVHDLIHQNYILDAWNMKHCVPKRLFRCLQKLENNNNHSFQVLVNWFAIFLLFHWYSFLLYH